MLQGPLERFSDGMVTAVTRFLSTWPVVPQLPSPAGEPGAHSNNCANDRSRTLLCEARQSPTKFRI